MVKYIYNITGRGVGLKCAVMGHRVTSSVWQEGRGGLCPLVVLMGTRFAMLVSLQPPHPSFTIHPSFSVCILHMHIPGLSLGLDSFDSCSRCFTRIKYVKPNIQEYPSKISYALHSMVCRYVRTPDLRWLM